ncbi:MAG: glycosyltransferase family 1 protein, partial [Candidatus Paceibacterota bacterium]
MENELKVKRDIIMLGIQPWDIEIGCNFKNMALEIAKQHRVLYVNRPLDRITALKKKEDVKTINRLNSIKKGIGVLDEVSSNLWVFNPQIMLESINWMPAGFIYQFFNKRNNRKLASEVRSASDQLHFKNSILLTDNDFYNGLYLKQYIGLDFEMYYLRDYLLSQPYFHKHGVMAEPKILAQADVVTTNSTYLANYATKYNKATYYIGQGCDVEEFAQKPTT